MPLQREEPTINPEMLPDEPGRFGMVVDSFWEGRYRQRWMPGAFGDRPTIKGVLGFKVIREEWKEDTADGVPERTILEAKVLSMGTGHDAPAG